MSRRDLIESPHTYAITDDELVPDAGGLLVLTRLNGEDVIMEVGGHRILIRCMRDREGRTRLAFKANREAVLINRREIWDRIQAGEKAEWEKFFGK